MSITYTLEHIQQFLAATGVEVIHHELAQNDDEFIIVLRRYVGEPVSQVNSTYVDKLRDRAFGFRDRWPGFRMEFTQYLEESRNQGDSIAIFGQATGLVL